MAEWLDGYTQQGHKLGFCHFDRSGAKGEILKDFSLSLVARNDTIKIHKL